MFPVSQDRQSLFFQCSESRRFVLPTTSVTYALGTQRSLPLWSTGIVRSLLSNASLRPHSCWHRIGYWRYVVPGVNFGFDGEAVIELIKKDFFRLETSSTNISNSSVVNFAFLLILAMTMTIKYWRMNFQMRAWKLSYMHENVEICIQQEVKI